MTIGFLSTTKDFSKLYNNSFFRYQNSCTKRYDTASQCYRYIQAPSEESDGKCAALTEEFYHYIIDESCHLKKSPLCIYVKDEIGFKPFS